MGFQWEVEGNCREGCWFPMSLEMQEQVKKAIVVGQMRTTFQYDPEVSYDIDLEDMTRTRCEGKWRVSTRRIRIIAVVYDEDNPVWQPSGSSFAPAGHQSLARSRSRSREP